MRVVIADPPAFTPRVRPRACGGACPRRSGCRSRHLPFSLRRRPRAGRLPPARDLLPAVVPALPALTPATAGQSGGAPARSRPAGCPPRRRRPPAVARGAGARRLAAPRPLAARLDRARPSAAADAHKHGLWRRLFGRFERIVVHSERGRRDARRVRRCRREASCHPPPRLSERRRSGATTGARCSRSGWIRPYKQIGTRSRRPRQPARASSWPARRSSPRRARGRTARELRLGYLSPPEIDRALGESTVAVFPYRAELDQSGALLQALGAGVPAGRLRRRRSRRSRSRYGAGRVVPPDDVAALGNAVRELLDDESALAEARAGAQRAPARRSPGTLPRAHTSSSTSELA